MYHNTTKLSGDGLKVANVQTRKQEAVILDFFSANPGQEYTPFEVHENCFRLQGVPITSTRRGISNLTSDGILEKTDNKRLGPYGKPSYTWRVRGE